MANHSLKIDARGTVEFIYSDDLLFLGKGIPCTTKRASHVEPDGSRWTADMSPIDGPVLGPFDTRSEALSAETDWINTYYLKTKKETL